MGLQLSGGFAHENVMNIFLEIPTGPHFTKIRYSRGARVSPLSSGTRRNVWHNLHEAIIHNLLPMWVWNITPPEGGGRDYLTEVHFSV